jgi:glucose/arabinose dehydrogenase
MKLLSSKPLAALASSLTLGIFLVSIAAQQAPPAAPAAPPAAGRGGRGGGGGGRGGPAPLGDGPWDFTSGQEKMLVTVVTKGVDHPWGLAFIPDGSMLVTERPGRLRVIRNGVLDPTPITGLPQIRATSLGGLLDITLHPQFAQNRLVYFTYSKPGAEDPAKAALAVGRGRWDGGPALTDVKDVFVAQPNMGGRGGPQPVRCCGQGPIDASYGSRIVFGRDGMLYITSGDRNYGEMSQDTSNHIGKIIRVRDDGTVPPDNPFVGREGYAPEIWSLGHRNPLGLAIHPVTGELWSTEFGPRGGDELNRIQKGKNYGWILITNGEHYNMEPAKLGKNSIPGYEDPVLWWGASYNPGNLAFYNGDKFPTWKGSYFMATMSAAGQGGPHLLRVPFDAQGKPSGAQEKMLTELGQRLRDVRVGPDGFLYVLTDVTAGAVLKIEPGK